VVIDHVESLDKLYIKYINGYEGIFLNGFAEKYYDKGFEIGFPNVILGLETIQNPP